jgi:hypothetical protein
MIWLAVLPDLVEASQMVNLALLSSIAFWYGVIFGRV